MESRSMRENRRCPRDRIAAAASAPAPGIQCVESARPVKGEGADTAVVLDEKRVVD
jgi:hypothetical protein